MAAEPATIAELAQADKREEESPAPSTSADKTDSLDVDSESKKLLGLGQKHLVMGDIPAAVNAFQEAASLLGKKYGETANECGEAFFYYGKSLLELARMENGVLGNALDGVPVDEDGERAEDQSVVESTDNVEEGARDVLKEQVSDATKDQEVAPKAQAEAPGVKAEVEMALAAPVAGEAQGSPAEAESTGADVEMKEEEEEAQAEAAPVSPEKIPSTAQESEAAVASEEPEAGDSGATAAAPQDGKLEEEEAAKAEAVVEEEQGEVVVRTEERPRDVPEEQPTTGEQGAAVRVEGEAADGGGEEEAEAAPASEAEKGEEKVACANEEPAEVSGEAQAAAPSEDKAEEQPATPPMQGPDSTPSDPGEAAPSEDQTTKELTDTQENSALDAEPPTEAAPPEESVSAQEGPKDLPEDSKTAGDGPEMGPGDQVALGTPPEEKDELMEEEEEGEETEGSEEEDKENERETEEHGSDSKLENKENEEEEIGNLELAWDMLDLAKIIFKRQETKEAQLNAAQAHLKLGEVSVESENYSQAIEEFQACLALQQNYLEAHDRLLAETHYQLGLAYSYNSQYGEAMSQFTKSVDVIEKRLAMLNERIKAAEMPSAEDEKEVEELKELLPEIKEKIEDAKESQSSGNVAELALKATLVQAASGFTSSSGNSSTSGIVARRPTDGAATTSSNCVTDISHLVRKKRKPEEESPQKEAEAKKPKQEPAVNGGGGDGDGGGDATTTQNEATENMEAEAEAGAATVQSTA
ncbi:nuclear autoantigenic sperm protein-like [Petaurus breviceps papuanus]|uniref:nuclear autoantigenic sperm protein-like n=1 Tax=Petaurus breviceps papuanus TaxID=3040969 RepID=UPI0036D8986B